MPNLSYLAKSTAPVQIVHGKSDTMVPLSNGYALYRVCRRSHPLPPAWIAGANHNEIESRFATEHRASVADFLAHLLKSSTE